MFGRNNDNETQGPQQPEEPKLIAARVFKAVYETFDEVGDFKIVTETITCRLLKETPAQLIFADAVMRSDGYAEYIVKGIPWSRIVAYEEVLVPESSGIII